MVVMVLGGVLGRKGGGGRVRTGGQGVVIISIEYI